MTGTTVQGVDGPVTEGGVVVVGPRVRSPQGPAARDTDDEVDGLVTLVSFQEDDETRV